MGSMALIGMTGLSALSGFAGAESGRAQQMAQARSLAAQAEATRKQAERTRLQGASEAERIDSQKSLLRRQYNEAQGSNRAALGAGNVDMASGSALDVAEGNINRLGQELADNAYNVALKRWETGEQERALNYQADVYDAQGSYLRRTAGNLGTSLLTGLFQGGMTYGMGLLNGAGHTGANKSDGNPDEDIDWFQAMRNKIYK